MSKMTNKKWAAMTSTEKYQYLRNGKKTCKSMMAIPANAKVNSDECKATTYYTVSVGGVTISEPHQLESDAFKQAEATIESWRVAAEESE